MTVLRFCRNDGDHPTVANAGIIPARIEAMDNNADFGAHLFPGESPWDAIYDTLWVSHREFWLVAGTGPGPNIMTAIPEGDTIACNGEAVGIPTLSEGRVSVALSVWEGPAPDGQGSFLGTGQINVSDRELSLLNVEGREPGPVLTLEEEGQHEVRVWRAAARSSDGAELFDVRIWPCPTSA
ncbi:hypothetical protein ACFT0G_02975 [Streptomyces sp. NPDC057020]|uniref:hypothetical protein n=1 Tax=unclassified Streptomyces TaxID=2593676 RepID=UPI00362C616F